jgi:hypothetical protein
MYTATEYLGILLLRSLYFTTYFSPYNCFCIPHSATPFVTAVPSSDVRAAIAYCISPACTAFKLHLLQFKLKLCLDKIKCHKTYVKMREQCNK